MKKLLTVTFLLAIASFLFTCTDDDLANPEPPAHCSDGILNNGELDIDCGGECNSCATLESPCNPDTNEVVLDSSLVIPFPNGTFTYSSIFGDQDGSNYEIICYNNTMEVDIKMYGSRPTVQRVYLLGGTYYLNNIYSEGHANVRLWHQTTGNKAVSTSGKLYVKPLANGGLMLTFCDAKFNSEVSPQTVVYNGVSGRIVEP